MQSNNLRRDQVAVLMGLISRSASWICALLLCTVLCACNRQRSQHSASDRDIATLAMNVFSREYSQATDALPLSLAVKRAISYHEEGALVQLSETQIDIRIPSRAPIIIGIEHRDRLIYLHWTGPDGKSALDFDALHTELTHYIYLASSDPDFSIDAAREQLGRGVLADFDDDAMLVCHVEDGKSIVVLYLSIGPPNGRIFDFANVHDVPSSSGMRKRP